MAETAKEAAEAAQGDLLLRESKDIQGNVLASFNKPYQRFVFISFRSRQAEARDWLKQFVRGVASTQQVVKHGDDRKREGAKVEPQLWVGVSFTSSGLVTLDPDLADDLVAYDAFWQGPLVNREYRGAPRTTPAAVGDVDRGDPTDWVVGGPRQYPVDALVTVAADDEGLVSKKSDDICGWARDRELSVLSWQDCRRLKRDGFGIEPLGFRDGISQPGIRGFTPSTDHNGRREAEDQPGSPIIAAGEFVLGYPGEGGSYPDMRRPRTAPWMRNGSFQVLLRLREDVDGWQTQMRELSESSGDTIDAAATAIGRTLDGVPLAAPGENGDFNDFTFQEEERPGELTPRFAHIRKMNPRNGTFDDRIHRLLRRGIPFGTPLHVETELEKNIADDGDERGLAFNAFMASIEGQFEFLQRSWASNPESLPPVAPDGPDPVVGVSDAPCVLHGAKSKRVEIHFGRFVWTSGAVYAFAPSRRALLWLADLDPDQVDA